MLGVTNSLSEILHTRLHAELLNNATFYNRFYKLTKVSRYYIFIRPMFHLRNKNRERYISRS